MKSSVPDPGRIVEQEFSAATAAEPYKVAYGEILRYTMNYNMSYEETPGLGGGTMLSPANRKNVSFEPSHIWKSLSNFEKYCLAFGRMGDNPTCDAVLTSIGTNSGTYDVVGLRGLTSGDFSSFAQQVMGGKYPNNYGIEIEYERKTLAHRAEKEKLISAERSVAQRDRMNAARRAKRAAAKSTV
jgi:hypothetical protein